MIVTVTINPAIDQTIELDSFRHGGLNRVQKTERDAGGKGVNVSKTLHAMGKQSVAAGFLAGEGGRFIEGELQKRGIACDFIRIDGETRTNTKICEADGTLTELNESGPEIPKEKVEELLRRLTSYAGPETLFVLSGSVPKSVESNVYARIIRLVREKGAHVILDTSGKAFAEAAACGPDMVKPNAAELEEFLLIYNEHQNSSAGSGGAANEYKNPSAGSGEAANECKKPSRESGEIADGNKYKKLSEDGAVTGAQICEALEVFKEYGISAVAVSLGALGAFFSFPGYRAACPALQVEVRSTVGAGDAMTAALAYAWEEKMSAEETARLCMAMSAAAVTTNGSKPPEKELVETLKKEVQLEVH